MMNKCCLQVYGSWWELNEQRGRALTQAVLERDKITEAERALWKRIEIQDQRTRNILD
jgi:hypothetical protein